ncbi:MAG: GNAT family N-acetyltransferase [Streptosporangiales bacterium]|nr:GNAT family N-acetyltransferase [Streptosporangiales bacterium]
MLGVTNPSRPPEKRLRFLPLPSEALAALADGDASVAEKTLGVALTGYFLTEEARWVWSYRLGQIENDPAAAEWLTRVVVDDAPQAAVGYAGFHGPPDASGTVELGYSVDPRWRRRGYARAILTELLARAAAAPGVRTVRATIRPDNTASMATIAGFGFAAVGEQWDARDGLETIYERPAR